MPTVHRFYVPAPLRGGVVSLPEAVGRQVGTVLRLRAGDPLVLFDGAGGEWSAELAVAGRHGASARLLDFQRPRREPALRVTLVPALIKADRFEWLLQKGTELGVAVFRPLLTRRTVPGAGARPERWGRIVIEAAEQSGRCVVPPVLPPEALPEILPGPAPAVLLWEGERHRPFAEALRLATAGAGEAGVCLVVGPEGGFEPDEVQGAVAAGALSASLGPRILRSETAALAAAALTLLTDVA